MERFNIKRAASVLLGIVLPVGIVVTMLALSLQHSYLQAADSFGVEFGRSMLEQARDTVNLVTDENWNTVNMASAAVPTEFSAMSAGDKVEWLRGIASSGSGRYTAYVFYDLSGNYAASDGGSGNMHYTSRPDISEVLAGTSSEAMYGPVFEDDVENETVNVAAADGGERGGYVVYFTVPVKNATGTVVGAISLRRDAYQYSDALENLNLGDGGYTCVVDASGIVRAASRSEYMSLVSQETDLSALDGAYGTAVKAAMRGESGTAESKDDKIGDATILYEPLDESVSATTQTAAETTGTVLTADAEATASRAGWAVLCYLPLSDLEGFMTKQAAGDMTGNLTTRLAILLLIALAVFYVVWDAYRFSRTEKTRAAREHKDVLEQTLRAMAAAAESRDVPNKGHGYRVAAYAREIGKHLDLDPSEEQNLYFEAALHDIGKLAVPEGILRHDAENKLTADEARRLNRHATLGGRILGRLTALPGINAGANYHHQHYDGGGYCSADVTPLKGEDIPLAARIITVADAYDRQAGLGRTNVDEMLESGKGGKYDPMIADIMIQLIHDGTIEKLTRETDQAMRGDSAELAEV